ncbi:conserved unknown protein [Ectocarpus siliculosus]|uniref:TNase-like domain-containing protein n=1 Tax=Ectocarpus siliculosus TaxID=2880 RepID=D7FRT5_ECTSI|nr:conserved unknown protein [Ectocarpus siliculosus]|eukprot:CBJ30876.1 conserved unknown protein [Ectocarpus siliculosus]
MHNIKPSSTKNPNARGGEGAPALLGSTADTEFRPLPQAALYPPLEEKCKGSLSLDWQCRRASIAIFTAGMLFGCCISSPVSANIRLYRTVPDIPKSMFKNHASLNGNVVTVSDGDSIRVRHKPNIPLPLPNRDMTGKKNSEQTLQIRLYAVDCPEVAHFGNPAQPFSAEAKAFTKEALQGKPVKIKLLSMDQYNRAVCRVQYGKWPFRKDISAELLKNGLGVVYRQGGAEYDSREESLTEYEKSAKSRKEGVWSRSNGETPAQYKARIKQQRPAAA